MWYKASRAGARKSIILNAVSLVGGSDRRGWGQRLKGRARLDFPSVRDYPPLVPEKTVSLGPGALSKGAKCIHFKN